jgi:hypothetical protein
MHWDIKSDRQTEFMQDFDTYEQAENACIDKLIELIN